MQLLTKGQKAGLDAIGCSERLQVTVSAAGPALTIDLACFGLDRHGKLADDRYLVFYNQLAAPEGAVRLALQPGGATFDIALAALPATVDKLVFTAAIDGAGSMAQLGPSELRLGQARFPFAGPDFGAEKAVIVGEIYRHGASWRVGAVGQGFAAGLAALLTHFGGAVQDAPADGATVPAPPPCAPVRLSKVTLTKAGETAALALDSSAGAPPMLVIKATWIDNGDRRADNDDLDLRAGLLLPDGRMMLIAAPGRAGAFDKTPFVQHQGDVKQASRKEPATEVIHVNPAIARHLGGSVALVFSVYSAVGNGAVSIASLQPRMRMEYGDQVIECVFDFSRAGRASSTVYTYVLGTAIISQDAVVLAPSGETSRPGSEHTPWLRWTGAGKVALTLDGPAAFKGKVAGGFLVRSPHKYS